LSESDRDRISKDRFARNEAIFREVNERVADVADSEARMTNFLCECGNLDCVEEIPLTDAEYKKPAVTQPPSPASLGMPLGDVETVIEETDRFHVVEKHPREAAIAEATDPSGWLFDPHWDPKLVPLRIPQAFEFQPLPRGHSVLTMGTVGTSN
jgi:hypothetical protein